ncbi:MAG: hypothetical protein IJZ60_06220 [Bacteroides sp.]|nr:hypothetical protein [Bacteroides sp.]
MAEENKINLNLDFESIVPWNGQQDTGRDVRLKLDRNWKKVVDAFNTLLNGEFLDDKYLRKDKDDRSVGTIASDKGFEIGKFQQGELGSGGILKMDEEGNSYLEVDKALFRKIAYFVEVMIKKLSHIGGTHILTPASMKCSKVEEFTDYYRCYFENEHEGRTINQEFVVGDQARSQTFNIKEGLSQNVSNQYYWRLVVGTGANYIDLSKTDCDSGSGVPLTGDEIVLCGNRDNPSRQNALILSSYGEGTPSLIMYKGIKSYSLADAKTTTKLSPEENELTGIVNIEAGSTGASNLEDFPEEVFKAVHIGAVNLLRNSGFTGDYKSEELSASSSLNSGSELYSKGLKYWTGSAAVSDDANAVSGKCAVVGSLSQAVELIKGESYVVSFKGKGTSVSAYLGGMTEIVALTSEYAKKSVKFISDGIGTFSISGDATICDLQLERGTIATDWKPSPYDNDKTLAEFQALKYLQDAIVEGDTTILGGIILSSIIKLGNFKDGKMQRVNAGVSGIYNDDNDVAFWGGGTFEEAIKTVMKFKENPLYRPTDLEWQSLANFVVTHGGDLFLRGYIHAKGGVIEHGIFKDVKSPNGSFTIDEEGNVKIIGTFETSVAGKRIIIDADSQSIVLYDELGRETAKMNFYGDVGESWTYGSVQLRRYQQDSSNVAMESFISASQVDVIDYITKYESHYRAGFMQAMSIDGKNASMTISLQKQYESPQPSSEYSWLSIIQSDCWPTSSEDVGVGGIYSDNGTLKVKR